jgi:hypothetical protein
LTLPVAILAGFDRIRHNPFFAAELGPFRAEASVTWVTCGAYVPLTENLRLFSVSGFHHTDWPPNL